MFYEKTMMNGPDSFVKRRSTSAKKWAGTTGPSNTLAAGGDKGRGQTRTTRKRQTNRCPATRGDPGW